MKYQMILCAMLLIMSCGRQNDTAIIRGKISGHSNENLFFHCFKNETDKYLNLKSKTDSCKTDKEGNFTFKINTESPKLFDLRLEDEFLCSNLFISNGDELKLSFSGNELLPMADKSTRAGLYNSFLLEFINRFFKEPTEKHKYYIESNHYSLPAYQNYTQCRRSMQKNLYEKYFQKMEVDSSFRNFILNEIDYEYVNDNLMLYWKRRMKYSQNLKDSTNKYGFLSEVKLMNTEALLSPAYYRFIHLFVNDKLAQEIESKIIPLDGSLEKRKICYKYFKGKYLQIALSDLNSNVE